MTHVTKETAVLLKEKGFDAREVCDWMYDTYQDKALPTELKNPNACHEYYSAPYLHDAADWLRKVKGVHLAIVPTFRKSTWDFQYFIYNNESKCWDLGQVGNYSQYTHDLALEAGIINALKNYVK